jgi:hypothetical protein
MCDPLIGGLISGAASLVAGASAASQQADLMQKQNDANAQWVAYQTKIHQDQVNAENQARQQAENARQDTLTKVGPQAQQQAQQTEQQRLNALYGNPGGARATPDAMTGQPSSLALSGEQTGNQTPFAGSLTAAVNNATTMARGRIAALATAGSYGGSFGGLGTTVPMDFTQGGNAINLQNAIRKGNLSTYGVEQQVQPLSYAASPAIGATQSIANALGGIAGTLVSSGIRGGGGSSWFGGGSSGASAPSVGGNTSSWM